MDDGDSSAITGAPRQRLSVVTGGAAGWNALATATGVPGFIEPRVDLEAAYARATKRGIAINIAKLPEVL
jgi:hypothetical protein